jgi:hypothetical protein
MTLLAHPPGTVHGELLERLLATCVHPRTERCRYCGAENDGIHASIFFDQAHTRCHAKACSDQHTALVKAVILELSIVYCACGKRKQEHRTFCPSCFRWLSGDLQRGLYAHITSGYLENYAAARAFLEGRSSVPSVSSVVKGVDRLCTVLIGSAVLYFFIAIGRAAEHWQRWKWMVGQ